VGAGLPSLSAPAAALPSPANPRFRPAGVPGRPPDHDHLLPASSRRQAWGRPAGHTFWVMSWLQLVSIVAIPAAGVTDPVRICSQTVLISFSTALPFGTPTICVE
jgi:hypothetical protein